MALSLSELGFATGQNSIVNTQTSLANAAASNTDSNIAMTDFTATSVDSISGSTSIDVGNSSTYSMQFSGESSRFSEIKNTDQVFSWGSADTSIITVSSGDFDTTATGQADGSATISSSIRDDYNFDDVTVTLNVTVQSATSFSPFSGSITAAQPLGDQNVQEIETINNVGGLIGQDVQFALDASTSITRTGVQIAQAQVAVQITTLDSSGSVINTDLNQVLTTDDTSEFNGTLTAILNGVSSNTASIELRREVSASVNNTQDDTASATIQDFPTPQFQTI